MLINRNISLLLIFLISFLILVPQMFGLGLSYDELATMTFTTSKIHDAIFWDNTPPLYYILLKTWFLFFPTTADSARFLNSIIASTFPIIGYLTAERFFGKKQALIAAVLFLFSAVHIRYSLELRSYLLFEVLCAANFFYFLKSIEEEKLSVGYAITILLTLCAHYLALFWLLAQMLAFVFSGKQVRQRTLMYIVTHQNGLVINRQNNLYSLEHLNLILPELNSLGENVTKNYLHYLTLIFLIAFIFLFRDPKYKTLDILVGFIILILISTSISIGKAPFVEKYFIFVIPMLLIRLSDVLAKVGKATFVLIAIFYLGLNGVRIIQQFGKEHSGWSDFLKTASLGPKTLIVADTNKPLNLFYDLKNSELVQYSEVRKAEFKNEETIYLVSQIENQTNYNTEDIAILRNFKLMDNKIAGTNSYEPLRVQTYTLEAK